MIKWKGVREELQCIYIVSTMMTIKIQKWGNSLAIRIPKAVAKDAHMKEGSRVKIEGNDGKLIIEREEKYKYNLDDLLAGITEENKHEEIDFGPPAGNEFGSSDSIYS
jgi:antitoxin MazE